MNVLVLCISAIALEFLPTPKDEEITAYDGYHLVWHDEFNENGMPSADWSYEEGFKRNHELQWYQPQNASVKDGCLVIEGRKERVGEAEYTSSSLTTQHSHTFMYGRFEVHAKIPTARGSWPAIWTLGNMWEWPMNGEIDLMEYYIKNGKPSILANACWGSNRRWTAVWDEVVTPFSYFTEKDAEWAEKFHLWRMDWDETAIRIYLDGELLNEVDLAKTQNQGYNGNHENPFNTSTAGFGHYILLNLAIGSNGGVPDDAKFPLHYYIDYVRVYQKDK